MTRYTPDDMITDKAEEIAEKLFDITGVQELHLESDFVPRLKANVRINREAINDVLALKGQDYLEKKIGELFLKEIT